MVAVPPIVDVGWLIPAFPLAGAVVLLFFGKRLKRASGPIATLMMCGAFAVSVITFFQVVQRPDGHRVFVERLFGWIAAGSFRVDADYRIDPLSIVMMLVITGVGLLIHLYSVGYMRDDPREGRYFAYLNLFVFSMLTLVMANNFLVLYVGWELVGLCSYLLIGFWFERPEAATAAKKAFITNRVGDFALMIGVFLIFATFGSLDFGTVFGSVSLVGAGTVTAIALLLFGGAAGKSAQIPLYVWLPDAMAGPTPVSALIHAATMVTAGVYLVVRAHVFFVASHTASSVVVWVGIATALLAGLIAIAQDDIKRVLAYSTVSQLGYMFVGVGTGAYAAGTFHLVTHAFFKALLFLGAGSVMHALSGRTDITKMGGLARKIPWTMFTFVLGWLAIVGFPGTSGFFSKDQILDSAYHYGKPLWALGLVATAITGFYMTRLVWLTFFGRSRDREDLHPHESPPSMVFPLVLLGVAAIFGGWIINAGTDGRMARFLGLGGLSDPASSGVFGSLALRPDLSTAALSAIATLASFAGVLLAILLYAGRAWNWGARREHPGIVWRTARNKFYVDEVYQFIFTGVGKVAASTLAYVVDARWIDGIVNGTGLLTAKLAASARKLQSGMVRTYALGVLGGTIIFLAFLVGRAAR